MKNSEYYPERCMPMGEDTEYPEVCPICGAGIKNGDRTHYKGPIYECGGQYKMKSQIQNHTDKWGGFCPIEYMEGLKRQGLLDAKATVWSVKKDGNRFHIASFSMAFLAGDFAKDFSMGYPRFWDDDSEVAYIEVLGELSGESGIRYRKGEVIAKKAWAHHINGSPHEHKWFKVKQINNFQQQYGEIITE